MGGNGGVTTGSLLNQRVFTRKPGSTSAKGSGVRTSDLIQTKVVLANRNKGTARGSYTAFSNLVNGRKEVVHTCSGKCEGSETKKTPEQIMAETQQWMALGAQALQLGQQIGGLFGPKDTAPPDKKDVKAGQQDNIQLGSDDLGASNNLASTLDALGFVDIDTTNINYKETANDFISQLKGAKNSQDLYQALQGAKAYKAQVETRMRLTNIDAMKRDLEALKGEAEGSIKKAESNLDAKDQDVRDAQSNVKHGQTQVTSARESYESAKAAIKTENQAYKDASTLVDNKTKEYDNAAKALSTAKSNYSTAKAAHKECTQARVTAEANTKQALSNLTALKAQQGSGTDGAALAAQIAQAQAQYEAAQLAEKQAIQAETNAKVAEDNAEKALNDEKTGAVKAFNDAKTELAQARDGLKAAAESLKNSKEISEEQYELLTNRQESLTKAETNLETRNEELVKAKDAQITAKDSLEQLEDQKERLEIQIHDYEEMQDASEKLSDLSKYETELTKMMTEEGTERSKLERKLRDQDYDSNFNPSTRDRKRAERKESRITEDLAALNAGDATDDIAKDKGIQFANEMNKLNEMAELGKFGLNSGIPNKRTINGHTVEYKNGKYFIDGGTTGLDKIGAELAVRMAKMPEFELPKFEFDKTSGSNTQAAPLNIGESLNYMAQNSKLKLMSGQDNKMTLNGHTVEYKDGKYFVDGGTTGMDRVGAEMLISTKAFNFEMPKKPNFGSFGV